MKKKLLKKLLIVESPAKIKTIKKFLGDDFRIMSTVGHIKDLPKRELGVTINGSIEIDYVTMDNKEKVIADICRAASTSDQIFLAPDPDREGEIIAWHIGQEIERVVKDKDKIKRITFNEITKPAILEAIENPFEVDIKKVSAQQARRVLDRWVGYEVSPVLWRKIKKGLSAGRVQSVALRMICEREEAIINFKPEEYWSVTSDFNPSSPRSSGQAKQIPSGKIIAPLTHISKKKIDLKNKEQTDKVVKDIKKTDFSITDIKDKKRTKNPLPPFMTSTLQQAAFNKLGFTVKKTMMLAQKLYEGIPLGNDNTPVALITYMRTDSKRISDTALKQVRSYVTKHFDKSYVPPRANIYVKGKKKSQDAHEAIRPIDVNITPSMIKERDMAKLYDLIWRRFVACQMTPAQYAQRQVIIQGGKYTFKATGSTLVFDGFLKVYKAEEQIDKDEKKVVLPSDIKIKDLVDLAKVTPKQHFTQPPPKYTEGSLVKEMEKEGIGRPSTYAAILNTIEARKYVTLDKKKKFTPTELGFAVTNMLKENLPKIMDIKFTALMEEDLDLIAKGEMTRDNLLREFYGAFKKDLEKFIGDDKKKKAIMTDVDCPDCKEHKLAIRFGKAGEFLGCAGFPDCTFTCNFERDEDGKIRCVEAQGPKELDEKCPKCDKNLREVIGKFGPFVSCSGYPDCKYIKKNIASFKCPLDGKGDVVEKKWRGGSLWGCSNYPKCKFAVFGDIEETKCPQCKKYPFLIKKVNAKGEITLMCYDKECGYKEKK